MISQANPLLCGPAASINSKLVDDLEKVLHDLALKDFWMSSFNEMSFTILTSPIGPNILPDQSLIMKLHRLLLPKLYARLEALKSENHRLKHQLDHVTFIEYAPPVSSPLYYQDKSLHLPVDKVMIPNVLRNNRWDGEMLEFAREILSQKPIKNYYFSM